MFLWKQHIKHSNMLTFKSIMMSTDEEHLYNVSIFVRRIMQIIIITNINIYLIYVFPLYNLKKIEIVRLLASSARLFNA